MHLHVLVQKKIRNILLRATLYAGDRLGDLLGMHLDHAGLLADQRDSSGNCAMDLGRELANAFAVVRCK